VYIGSHPTKSLLAVDAKDGNVLGDIDLGGTPEQTRPQYRNSGFVQYHYGRHQVIGGPA
jgi:hypothetical protein